MPSLALAGAAALKPALAGPHLRRSARLAAAPLPTHPTTLRRPTLRAAAAASAPDPQSTPKAARRRVDASETILEPFGRVEELMTPADSVTTTRAGVALRDLLGAFESFTGLPVVDDGMRVVGVISEKDVERAFPADSALAPAGALAVKVGDVMSTPAVTIGPRAHVAYAAGLMLKHKCHRLPVVDADGRLVGIVSRTDLFEPLLAETESLAGSDPAVRFYAAGAAREHMDMRP